jgi:hypothetical protein
VGLYWPVSGTRRRCRAGRSGYLFIAQDAELGDSKMDWADGTAPTSLRTEECGPLSGTKWKGLSGCEERIRWTGGKATGVQANDNEARWAFRRGGGSLRLRRPQRITQPDYMSTRWTSVVRRIRVNLFERSSTHSRVPRPRLLASIISYMLCHFH